MFGEIFKIPYEFLQEYLTGWVLLIIVLFLIYFIYLRNIYRQRELFNNSNIIDNENNKNQSNNPLNKPLNKPLGKIVNKHKKENVKETKIEEFQSTEINNSNELDKTLLDTQLQSTVSTTIFDNLNLSQKQKQDVLNKYNQVIADYVVELGKLTVVQTTNPYINISKQFDNIITKGINNIINYLTNTIKSLNSITRTSIRNDLLNTLNIVLENLTEQTQKKLIMEMDKLAGMNSTTIDYNTALDNINKIRIELDKYINISKMSNEYGIKNNLKNRTITEMLDKSTLLPIYERNFDKINQLINTDYNGNETIMAEKYSRAYNEFINQQKKEELNINPLEIASNIESGIVDFIGNIASGNSQYNITQNKNQIVEQYSRDYGFIGDVNISPKSNPIPTNETTINLNRENIFVDPGNRGAYLINNTTQKQILEHFENNVERSSKNDKQTKNNTYIHTYIHTYYLN